MGLLLSGIGMLYILAVAGLAVAGTALLISVFFGFPVVWGLALAIVCFSWARNGWAATHGVMALIGPSPKWHNGHGAFGLLHVLALTLAVSFALSPLPHILSAWWALLLPLAPILMLVAQAALEWILNVVNPSGKRP